jgi:hypothetical protein
MQNDNSAMMFGMVVWAQQEGVAVGVLPTMLAFHKAVDVKGLVVSATLHHAPSPTRSLGESYESADLGIVFLVASVAHPATSLVGAGLRAESSLLVAGSHEGLPARFALAL